MKTEEIIAAIEKKDDALHQARHLMEKWDMGFDMDDFGHDVACWLLDVGRALGETE
jgi:hypothetical protein